MIFFFFKWKEFGSSYFFSNSFTTLFFPIFCICCLPCVCVYFCMYVKHHVSIIVCVWVNCWLMNLYAKEKKKFQILCMQNFQFYKLCFFLFLLLLSFFFIVFLLLFFPIHIKYVLYILKIVSSSSLANGVLNSIHSYAICLCIRFRISSHTHTHGSFVCVCVQMELTKKKKKSFDLSTFFQIRNNKQTPILLMYTML